MDVRSILRVFRYGEMQSRSDRDPEAKRPPTIKFLSIALFLGLLLVGLSFWTLPHDGSNATSPLTVSSTSPPVETENATASPSETPEPQAAGHESPDAPEPARD